MNIGLHGKEPHSEENLNDCKNPWPRCGSTTSISRHDKLLFAFPVPCLSFFFFLFQLMWYIFDKGLQTATQTSSTPSLWLNPLPDMKLPWGVPGLSPTTYVLHFLSHRVKGRWSLSPALCHCSAVLITLQHDI